MNNNILCNPEEKQLHLGKMKKKKKQQTPKNLFIRPQREHGLVEGKKTT